MKLDYDEQCDVAYGRIRRQGASADLGGLGLSGAQAEMVAIQAKEVAALRAEVERLRDEIQARNDPTLDLIHANQESIRRVQSDAIQAALQELGEPNKGYPQPVANAVEILRWARQFHPMRCEFLPPCPWRRAALEEKK